MRFPQACFSAVTQGTLIGGSPLHDLALKTQDQGGLSLLQQTTAMASFTVLIKGGLHDCVTPKAQTRVVEALDLPMGSGPVVVEVSETDGIELVNHSLCPYASCNV